MVRRRLGRARTSGTRSACRSASRSLSTRFALVLGTLAAAALSRTQFFGREAISLLLVLPIALPGIITGISLRSAFNLADIPFSFWTIVLGHATFCIVVVYNNAVARFRRLSPSLVEASMDLGADGFQTFRHVVLPSIGTALLAGGMLAFALSFDEVIVTTFTAGQQKTLPIWMLSELIRPRQRPVTNVVAVDGHRRDRAADPRRLLPHARRRARRRRRQITRERPSCSRRPMLDTAMLIGSSFVAGTEAPEKVLNPKTEETIVDLPEASAAAGRRGRRCRRKGLRDMVADDAGASARRCCSSSPTRSRGTPRPCARSRR